MQNKKYLIIAALVGIFVCIFLLSGCATQGRNTRDQGNATQQPENMAERNTQNMDPRFQNVNPQDNNAGLKDMNQQNNLRNPMGSNNNQGQQLIPMQQPGDAQKARNIETQLKNMDGIDRANCVVSGNTAVIGYTPSRTTKDTTAVKNMIINRVKQLYPNLTEVAVSEKTDIIDRIRQLSNDMMNNRNNNMNEKVMQLLRRINPVVR
jgi:hypothetical protein